jgi:hypothetical protein
LISPEFLWFGILGWPFEIRKNIQAGRTIVLEELTAKRLNSIVKGDKKRKKKKGCELLVALVLAQFTTLEPITCWVMRGTRGPLPNAL